MVMVRPYCGSSGTYFRTSSSSRILPSPTRSRIAVAVNCLATEPLSRIVCAVIGVPLSRSAMP